MKIAGLLRRGPLSSGFPSTLSSLSKQQPPLTLSCRLKPAKPSARSFAQRIFSGSAATRSCGMAHPNSWGAWQVEPAKFTRLVADSMRKLYPEELADRSFDNVGLLVDNSESESKKHKPKVLVANDVTYQVAEDAIKQGVSVIVSYHPLIFSGLKSITNRDAQQATILRLVQAGIAVYSPHTAVDAAPDGLNTWLADLVAGPHSTSRAVAVPCTTAPDSHAPAGYGAVARFDEGGRVPLPEILRRVADKCGGARHLMVASPVGADVRTTDVGSFAVCAGSGYSVVKDADVDLLLVGETSHHSALRAIQQGRTLVQVFHSNSERGYLREKLRPRLEAELRASVPEAEVVLSEYDKDPFSIVDVSEL